MKRRLLTFAIAVITVGLLGSCSKLNERIDSLEKRIDGIENTQIASVGQQITAINASINDLKAADATINDKITELKTTAEAQQTLIDALKEADQALGQKDAALEARIATLEGQVVIINGQIKTLEDAGKAINDRIDELKSYIDTEIGKAKDWATATFATLAQYRQTADDLAALSVTVSGINSTLAEVQASIAALDTKINGIDAALQGKISGAKTELEGKIAALKTELEGKIAEAVRTSETGLQNWVNEQLSAYYTAAQMDAKIAGLKAAIDALVGDNDETNKAKIQELEAKLTQLTQAMEEAKTTIKTEYEAAIATAINENNGTITQTIQDKINEVNETITALTGRVEALETTVGILSGRIDAVEADIATIGQQIAAINQSISDLETIRTNIQTLIDAKAGTEDDITSLKAKDQALEGKITDLKNYVDTELAKYATTEWANATFATLAKQEEIIADVAKLKQDLKGLDDKLDQAVADIKANLDKAIADLGTSLQGWVNEQLNAYYTAAQVDAEITDLQNQINTLKTDTDANKTKIEELETKLTQLTKDLEEAKTTIKIEYEAAIAEAINENNGIINETIQTKINEVNETITALTGRVDELALAVSTLQADVAALKAMIQSVTILPAYTDGSVEAKEGTLTIDFVVSPAAALAGVTKDSIKVLVYEAKVMTRTVSYTTLEVASAVVDETAGNVTITADISEIVPADGNGLTAAVNVRNGLSDFTSEFVPVYVAPGPDLPAGALSGEFSVSATKKVHFSQGNLVATIDASGTPTAWKFAANQYDYIGGGGANKTIGSAAGDVDLFGWSTSNNGGTSTTDNYGIMTSKTVSDYSGDFYDWGKAIGDGNTWRTLSKEEWQYLFNNHSYKWATVGDVNGYVIAPDDFSGELSGTYADDAALAANNLVFLPAAGNRDEPYVVAAGTKGRYWSSTAYDVSNANIVDFSSSNFTSSYYNSRRNGYSVRLITDASAGGDAPEVKVTGVTMSKEETTIIAGNKETLVATVAPANATNKKITWSSSKPSVATVDKNGVVTGVAVGSANIFAITADGNFIAVCQVTVKPTTGTAKRKDNIDVNWVQLWKDGPKFAEYNVGVTDGKAESYGGYYTWGGIKDKDAESIYNKGNDTLSGDDDTATNLWGENWRMPTKAELDALLNSTNCTVAWTDDYNGTGIKGRIYTGKDAYASNSVFLPAAGSCDSGSVTNQSKGYYWSSTPDGSDWANYLYFHSNGQEPSVSAKKYGFSVRAVLAEED